MLMLLLAAAMPMLLPLRYDAASHSGALALLMPYALRSAAYMPCADCRYAAAAIAAYATMLLLVFAVAATC